ncbi:MAG: hypothetical protein HYU77_11355 [Betaproteobacteria bacterium]|nr:hypothetical protein [Betaproteobacteria bacterium]
MNTRTVSWPFSRASSILCALAATHALLILLAWLAAFVFDAPVINARIWLVIAWLWIVWIFVLAPRLKRDAKLIIATAVICAAIFWPTASTIYSFTIWAISGFAP